MSSRSKRILQWTVAVVVALVIFGIGQFIEYKQSLPEKQPLTVYAPSYMEEAFEKALNYSDLSESHYVVMSDNPNSNICVTYGKQGDESYEKIAYSPFVVVYEEEESYFKKLKKADVCSESAYNSEYYEIDFLKVINEAIGDGEWENLGITKQGNLRVFYPDKETVYWSDFHDFLLVTLNDGRYPESEEEFKKAEETILEFLNSKYTEGVTDFGEQVKRTSGFPSMVMYIWPEQEATYICRNEDEYARFFYPTKTVYVNYYITGDELGNKLIEALDEETIFGGGFYNSLYYGCYRTTKYPELYQSGYVYGDGDVFNVAKIPENKEFATSPTIPKTSEIETTPTSE